MFWIREGSERFPYKLMVIASLLFAILAYERFRMKTPLLDSGGNLHVYVPICVCTYMCIYIHVCYLYVCTQ